MGGVLHDTSVPNACYLPVPPTSVDITLSLCVLLLHRFIGVVPTIPFELPDGSVMEVDGDRLRMPELYFDPSPVAVRRPMRLVHMR